MLKRIWFWSAVILGLVLNALGSLASAQYVTLTGQIQGSNGSLASNYTLSFTPSQTFYIAGTSVVVATTSNCATSVDGSTVGIGNPLQQTVVSSGFSGTLTPANYYVKYSFYTSSTETLVSPETVWQLTATGQIVVNAPTNGIPSGALGMRVYIGTSSGSETLQGQTSGTASFVRSTPLAAGAAIPATNTTVCRQVANDVGWPTGTGYNVSLADSSGNTLPGYPMLWQLMGANTTINLSNGLPYYHGIVYYPTPLLASPPNHVTQSISGPLSLSGYNLLSAGRIGVGTNLPAWSVDVEGGLVNSSGGYLVNGSGGSSGQAACSNGTAINSFCTYYSPSNPPPSSGYTFSSRFAVSGTAVDLATFGPATSCTNCSVTADAYGRVSALATGTVPSVSFTQTDQTTSRALGTTYQNTGAPILIQGYVVTTAGGADGVITCSNGSTSSLGNSPYIQNPTSTDAGGSAEFHLSVPSGWFYRCTATGTMNATLGKWYETVL